MATDPNNDLALFKMPSASKEVASFRSSPPLKNGENIVVVGFPLHGILAPGQKVTTGTISALAGPSNDSRLIQITAPVQQGNSGGPLLDESGKVIGVVVGKLDALKVAKITGDIPQNVNFAIHGAIVRAFLETNGVPLKTSASAKKYETKEIADQARSFVVHLECFK
jgi:hypothetical protein